jgi:hypothetical protein
MSLLRRSSLLGLVLLLTAGVSCTNDNMPTGPSVPAATTAQPSSFGLIGDLTGGLTGALVGTLGQVSDLLLCSPQPYASSTETIGPEGGVIAVGRHWLVIPRNALSQDVTITAEQVSG